MFASKVVNQTGIAVLCPLKLLTHFFKRGVRAVYFVLWAAYLCFELVWKLEKKKHSKNSFWIWQANTVSEIYELNTVEQMKI